MKKAIFTIIALIFGLAVHGQNEEALKKIESAKIALITERLNLTPEQAEKFWPIYNEFQQRQREITREFRNARQNFDPKNASEEENKRILEIGMRLKQNKLDLEQEYTRRLLRVINNRQMVSLRKAEDDFKEMLLRKIRERNRQQERLKQNRNLNQRRKDRGNGG